MAKKKNAKSVRTTTTKKAPATGKAAKKKPTRKKAARKTSKAKSATPLSVDGVLEKYTKERGTLQSSLSTVQKKIADLKKKTLAFQQQIEKLTTQEATTAEAIATLDSRRDTEVSQVLAKLGVSVGAIEATADKSNDEAPADSGETNTPDSDNKPEDAASESTRNDLKRPLFGSSD